MPTNVNRIGLKRIVAVTIVLIGISLMARPLYHLSRRLYIAVKSEHIWADTLLAKTTILHNGAPTVWLRIEKAGVDSLILSGANNTNLSKFPSCHSDYATPGNDRLSVILGHRDTHFSQLYKVNEGATINLQTRHGEWKNYRVINTQIIDKDLVPNLMNCRQDDNKLALMTCYPFNYIGPAPKRFIVWADPV